MESSWSACGVPTCPSGRRNLEEAVERYAAERALVPPLSMEELRYHAGRMVEADAPQFDYTMVLLNNVIWRETVASVPFERRLLLLPLCLRNCAACPAELDEFGLLCEECGRCDIGELQARAEALGYVVLVAEGSTVVTRLLESGKVDAVVGVSCLNALEKSFPHMAAGAIPGLAIPLTVDGCVGTEIDAEAVCRAIELRAETPWRNRLDTDQLRRRVDAWFESSAAWPTETGTEKMAYDWLLQEGKRWRPFLLACTYSACRGGTTELPDDVRRLAIGVECFHKASLIHDDIEDDDDLRYGSPTLHCRYGIPVAINVGDLLVGEGYRWIASVSEQGQRLIQVAAANHRTLCLGQGEELSGVHSQVAFSVEELVEIFRRKTAPAFGVALELGALAAGADEELLETLRAFSESLGIAYQIRDDLDEYRSGESADLRASLLLALANQQRAVALDPSDPDLFCVFEQLKVDEKAAQLLEHYKNEAIRALNPLKSAPLKGLLRRVVARMLGGM